jgi:iron complex outermembrane receptor protein
MKINILAVGALSLVASSLLADTFELGKIEAVGAKDGDSSSVSVIDSTQLKDYERKTLPEALNLLPGVNIQNGGGRNEQMIMLRGFDVKHAPLFVDGIPIAVPYDGYVDFSRFTTFDLSEIEVSKGLTSVLLGSNTFAGAINMVTKKPTKTFEGEMGAGIFSGNGSDEYITLGSNQGKYYVMASLSAMSRDGYPLSKDFPSGIKYEDGSSRNNSYAKDTKINLKAGYTPNTTDEYAFNYIKQSADKGVPPYSGLFNTVIKNNASGNAIDNSGATNNAFGGGTVHFWKWRYWDKDSYYFLSKTEFDKWYIKTRLFYDKFQNSLAMYTDPTYSTLSAGSANYSFYDDTTKGASVEAGVKISDKDTLKFAAHYKLDMHKEGGVDSVTSVSAPQYEMQDKIYSFGAEYKKALTESSTLVVGASYDKEAALKAQNTNYGAAGVTYTQGSAVGPAITSYTTLRDFSLGSSKSFNPMIKLDTKVDDSLSIYGGVSKKSRIPSIKDRYSFKLGNFVPNPDLTAESTTNYEIGASKKLANGIVKAAIFYGKVKDYIQSAYVPIWYNKGATHTQQQQLQNIGEVSQKGIEFEGTYLLNDQLSFDGSFTRLLMRNDTTPDIKITDVPKDKIIIGANYTPISALSWINSLEYDSERLTSYALSNSNVYYSSGVEAVWNTKLIYRATKALSCEVGANNVLDRNYYVNYGYPEAGRVYYGNVRYKF